ncbi:MAG: hypothetical protein ABGW77_01080 [Campylobacterales bacterium]
MGNKNPFFNFKKGREQERLKKVVLKNRERGIQMEVVGSWRGRLGVPFPTGEKGEWGLELYFLNSTGEKVVETLPFPFFLEFLKGRKGRPEWWDELMSILDFETSPENLFFNWKIPELIEFQDLTDWDFNNFSPIPSTLLRERGLWIGSGYRFLEFQLERELVSSIPRLRITGIENGTPEEYLGSLPPHLGFIGRVGGQPKEGEKGYYTILLDTNQFLPLFEKFPKNKQFSIEGQLEIDLKDGLTPELNGEVEGILLSYPISFTLVNPVHREYFQPTRVAIDFGTSSTCVAVGDQLIPFSDHGERVEDYENMTAITIYSWKNIWNRWKPENLYPPHFTRNKKEIGTIVDRSKGEEQIYHYDYGNRIRKELSYCPYPEVVKATIEQIKLLPRRLKEEEIRIEPFDRDFKKLIYLTDKIEEEGEERLNPIYLYGYLIGRAVNRQIGEKLYTNYILTMPILFSNEMQEILRVNLEGGIRRALPKPIQSKLKVQIRYPEPVALIGAGIGIGAIEGEVVPFGIFDFGGGTLDYVAGIYRTILTPEEEEEFYEVVELFGAGGVEMGGEKLIERLAYQIYDLHREEMEKLEIPIYVPEGERNLEGFPERLLGRGHLHRMNLQILVEEVARKFFENGIEPVDLKISLFPISDPSRGVEVSLPKLKEPIALERLEGWLRGRLGELVEGFNHFLKGQLKEFERRILQLKRQKRDIEFEKVVVLKAGNASKNELVSQLLEEQFSGKMWKLQEIFDEEMGITPKNGVAKGANLLESVKVVQRFKGRGQFQFQLNIWNWKALMNKKEKKPIISQGRDNSFPFQWLGFISKGERTIRIFYSQTLAVKGIRDPALKQMEFSIPEQTGKGFSLWGKPAGEYLLECKLGDKTKVNLGNPSFYIDLKKGMVISKLD